MRISFAPLVSLHVAHDYYRQASEGFEFIPTAESRALLRGAHTLARTRAGELHLLFEAEPAAPRLDGATLFFGLRSSDPSFANFTQPLVVDPPALPMFRNSAGPSALGAPTSVYLTSGVHAHVPRLGARPLNVKLEDAAGRALSAQRLDGDRASFDLRNLSPGSYRVVEDDGATADVAELFVDADLRAAGVWGVLALRIDASFYTSAPRISLQLAARKETLRYYVVTRNWPQTDFDQIRVVDEGSASDSRALIEFEKKAPPFAPDLVDAASLDGDRVALFESKAEVARRERGWKKLRLKRNGTILIEQLPMPGPQAPKADVFVYLSNP